MICVAQGRVEGEPLVVLGGVKFCGAWASAVRVAVRVGVAEGGADEQDERDDVAVNWCEVWNMVTGELVEQWACFNEAGLKPMERLWRRYVGAVGKMQMRRGCATGTIHPDR